MKLLKEIQSEAVNAKQPIADVLRKCAVLATALKNDELRDWAFKELNGYDPNASLPDYRILPAQARVSLSGPFQSGYTNVIVPAFLLPEQLRDYAEKVCLRQPTGPHSHRVSGIDSGELFAKNIDEFKKRDGTPWIPMMMRPSEVTVRASTNGRVCSFEQQFDW